MTKRDESNFLVSPSINQSQNRTLQFNQSDIQQPCFLFRIDWECDFIGILVDQMGNPEVEPMLPQVSFALGFVPFVHWVILVRLLIIYCDAGLWSYAKAPGVRTDCNWRESIPTHFFESFKFI